MCFCCQSTPPTLLEADTFHFSPPSCEKNSQHFILFTLAFFALMASSLQPFYPFSIFFSPVFIFFASSPMVISSSRLLNLSLFCFMYSFIFSAYSLSMFIGSGEVIFSAVCSPLSHCQFIPFILCWWCCCCNVLTIIDSCTNWLIGTHCISVMGGATGDVSLLFPSALLSCLEYLVSTIRNIDSLIPYASSHSKVLALFSSTHISQIPSWTFLLSAYTLVDDLSMLLHP